MYFRYGSYTHALGEVTIAIDTETKRDQEGIAYAEVQRWTVSGVLLQSTLAELTAAIAQLKSAYSRDGQDAAWIAADGTVVERLLTAGATQGVLVRQRPGFPRGGAQEFVNSRTYQIILEAEYPFSDGDGQSSVSFTESIQFSGGGPRVEFVELLDDLPQKQEVVPATVYRAVQSGQRTQQGFYPSPPPPAFPGDLSDAPQVSLSNEGQGKFSCSWQYQFASASPMRGLPNIG